MFELQLKLHTFNDFSFGLRRDQFNLFFYGQMVKQIWVVDWDNKNNNFKFKGW